MGFVDASSCRAGCGLHLAGSGGAVRRGLYMALYPAVRMGVCGFSGKVLGPAENMDKG